MKHRVDWDATDGRNGGAQQVVWEILMEMERFYGKDAFQFPKEDHVSDVRLFRAPVEGTVRRMCGPLQTISAILPGSQWSCLLCIE